MQQLNSPLLCLQLTEETLERTQKFIYLAWGEMSLEHQAFWAKQFNTPPREDKNNLISGTGIQGRWGTHK